MTISLSQSRNDLRGLLHEPRAVRWADSELNTLLDLGQKHVAALTLSYTRRATFRNTDAPQALLLNLRDYALAGTVGAGGLSLTDVLAVKTVYLNDAELVEIIPKAFPTWDARSRTVGAPRGWYEFAEVLSLIPYPSSAFLASYDLEIIYAAQPADWTTGNSVLPEGMSDLVLYFSGALALFAVQKYADAVMLYDQYMQWSDAYIPISATQRPTAKAELAMPSHTPGG